MKRELEKNYDPKIEGRIYGEWLEKNYYHAEPDPGRKPFTLMMPPPNVTGELHMGHALTYTLQDILVRYKRMRGFNTLWMPGTDHASISTEVKIVDALAEEGLTKKQIGREKYMERAWEWKRKYSGAIVNQLKLLGISCDWERERFTMDEGLSGAVLTAFVTMYEKGYIYRGEKLINWCPQCRTTISDAEVEHEDIEGTFYHFKYKIDQTDGYIEFATTRPETMLGDTAVAVNPKDGRYTHLVGKTVTVPVVNRTIPIIADEYVEMDFGTGAVKITPGHDPNDYEVGERHGLAIISILNDDGTLNKNAGAYEGMDRYAARERITEEFKGLGLFVKSEKITHAVGTHDRCNQVMEPMVKLQWFVRMKEIAKPAIDAYQSGGLRIHPDRAGKVYLNWLNNIRDWCVSRQLWWGHRIPAYYCESCGQVAVAYSSPEKCVCGCARFVQDEDVLDTWFSSALWPFSTLGWPEETPEYKYFYPTDVLITGNEILFFWVIRMVFSGLLHTGQLPFRDVMLHGMMRASDGRKMSKSWGNGIDPLEVIEKYGADALRLMIVTGNALENDTRFYWERMDTSRNFINKLWNATRFILTHLEEAPEKPASPRALTSIDKWILSRMNRVIRETTEKLEEFDFGMAAQKVYDFVWDEFCDWYIETAKPRLYDRDGGTRGAALFTLHSVLTDALKLLHPYIPFITEEIYSTLQSVGSISLTEWPKTDESLIFPEDEKLAELFISAVKGVRAIRLETDVAPSKKIKMFVVSPDAGVRDFFRQSEKSFCLMAGASVAVIQENADNTGADAVSAILGETGVYIPLAELLDREKELARLEREIKKLESEVARGEGKLNNAGFLAKAPEALVSEEKSKLALNKTALEKVLEQRNNMN